MHSESSRYTRDDEEAYKSLKFNRFPPFPESKKTGSRLFGIFLESHSLFIILAKVHRGKKDSSDTFNKLPRAKHIVCSHIGVDRKHRHINGIGKTDNIV